MYGVAQTRVSFRWLNESMNSWLFAETPTHGFEFFETPETEIEHEADEPDQHHCGDNEVIALAGIAGVTNQITEAGIDRDHFRRHHDQPGDTERNPKAGDDGRQCGREDHLRQNTGVRQAEVFTRAPQDGRNVPCAVHGRDDDGKKSADENQERRRGIADSIPDDGQRYPGEWADRPHHLNYGIDNVRRDRIPAERETGGNSDQNSETVANRDAAEGVQDIPKQDALCAKFLHSLHHSRWRGKHCGLRDVDGEIPDHESDGGDKGGPEEHLPLRGLRLAGHILWAIPICSKMLSRSSRYRGELISRG